MTAARRRNETPGGGDLGRARPSETVDTELAWFFNAAEGELGDESNFGRLFSSVSNSGEWRTPEAHVEAARAYYRIRAWLRAMPDSDAGVLQAAYEPRPWPRRVRQELKLLTGIAVRLTTDPATWPERRELQLADDAENAKILDRVCADRGPKDIALLQDLRRLAEARLAGAIRRYVEVRGPGPCIVRQP
jgi:hypothetical protein